MRAELFTQLRPGDVVILTQDAAIINAHGLQSLQPGSQQVIHSTEPGNNKAWIQCGRLYVVKEDLQDPPGQQQPSTRFGRAEVECIRQQGGNDAIRREIAVRVHAARSALQQCLVTTPQDQFNPSLKTVELNLRAAKLLHQMLAK